jgi:DNA-binding NtrC family response regulator
MGTDPLFGDELVGESSALAQVHKDIAIAGPCNISVLITGESGTGKELVARALFRRSLRAGGPFIAVNCGAISESLAENELFGHEKGAFTGADQRQLGKLERAHLGTFFLDEVAEMALATQAKFLRVLDRMELERVGGQIPVPVDIRVIAATHQDLPSRVAAGAFRRDLFYRLAGYMIHVPALGERADDIPLLVEHYLPRVCREMRLPLPTVSAATMRLLEAYRWPGNVRELQNVLRQAVGHTRGGVLLPEALLEEVRRPAAEVPARSIEDRVDAMLAAGGPGVLKAARTDFDRMVVKKAMDSTAGNQRSAAKLLGVSRTTFVKMLRALELDRPDASPPSVPGP